MTRRVALGISVLWIPLAFLFDGITVLVLPVKVATGTDPASAIGLISFVGLGAALVVQPVAGAISDRLRNRIDRRWFVAIPAVPVLAGLWLLVGATSVVLVAGGYLLVQLSASALQAAQQTLIPEHVERTARGRAAGLKTAFDLGGAFLAFLSLGVLLAANDTVPVAALITVLLIISVVLLAILVPATRAPTSHRPEAVRAAPPAQFRRLVLARFLFLLGTYGIGRFLLLLIANRMGIDPLRATAEIGSYLAFFTLITAGTALLFGTLADRVGQRSVMRFGIVSSAVGIAAFLPAAGVPGVLIAGTIMSIGTAAFVSANWAATTQVVPAEHAGRLMGIANLGTGGAAACAGLLGPLIDRGGFTPAIVLAGLATLAALAPLGATASRHTTGQPI